MTAEQDLADVVSQLLQCCIEFHQADLSGGILAEEGISVRRNSRELQVFRELSALRRELVEVEVSCTAGQVGFIEIEGGVSVDLEDTVFRVGLRDRVKI